MRTSIVTRGASLVLATLLVPAVARGDQRYYGETYNASIAPVGAVDLELWSTSYAAPRAGGVNLWRHQLELETGLTDHWDVALYNIVVQPRGEPLQYEATKLETRYRLADPGAWPVDVVLYLEGRKEWIADKPWAVEQKLILARDFGRLNVSVNGAAEQEFPSGGGIERDYEYAAGTSYEVVTWARIGAEAFGQWSRGPEAGAPWVAAHWAGPTLSLAFPRGWLVLAASVGLNEVADRYRARAILALQF
jgi:hypothetical protein